MQKIGITGDGKSTVVTLDGRSRKKKKIQYEKNNTYLCVTRPKYRPDSRCGHYSVHCLYYSAGPRSSDYLPASVHISAGPR